MCLCSVAIVDACCCQDHVPASPYSKALFSPDDQLILSGYSLFDVRSASVVHRFDRLARSDVGATTAFHSNGQRVVLNSAVWDLRTMKLVTVCSSLTGAAFRFSGQCTCVSIVCVGGRRLSLPAPVIAVSERAVFAPR